MWLKYPARRTLLHVCHTAQLGRHWVCKMLVYFSLTTTELTSCRTINLGILFPGVAYVAWIPDYWDEEQCALLSSTVFFLTAWLPSGSVLGRRNHQTTCSISGSKNILTTYISSITNSIIECFTGQLLNVQRPNYPINPLQPCNGHLQLLIGDRILSLYP